jgi:AraC-like DNA-binding protein
MLEKPFNVCENLILPDVDPLSDVLAFIRARTVVAGGFTAGGSWAVAFPPTSKLKFWGITQGECWLSIEGEKEAKRVREGDVFLLVVPRQKVLASEIGVEPVHLHELAAKRVGAIARHGSGDSFSMIGGTVELDPLTGGLLLAALPPLVHIRPDSPQAPTVHWLLDRLVGEAASGLPGASAISGHFADAMFVEILRSHMAAAGSPPPGWLRAVTDARLAPALKLMHASPGRSWQLHELAGAAAMSRATFAHHFRAAAGISPLAYLTEWRMRLAQRMLRDDPQPVAAIALSLGYASESSFSTAFKRVVGAAPRHYREAARRMPRPEIEADPAIL